MQANSNAVALEELTLSYEGLNVVDKSGGSAGGGASQSSRDGLGFHSSF